MLFVTIVEKYRSDAEDWLSRAVRSPVGSWDRERLLTAAKLNRVLADRIERRCLAADELKLNGSFGHFPQLRDVRQRASAERAERPVTTRCDQRRSAGSDSSS